MKRLGLFLRPSAVICVSVGLAGCGLLRVPANLIREAAKPKPAKQKADKEQSAHGLSSLAGGAEKSSLAGGVPAQFLDPSAKTTADGIFDFSAMTPGQGFTPKLAQWQRSVTEVMQSARKQGKLVLVFATHSAVDAANQMESTVLSTPNFVRTIAPSVLMLRVDYGDADTKGSETYAALKSKLSIRGFPTLCLLQPDGKALLHLTGYTSDSKGRYLQSLKDTIDRSPQIFEKRRKQLEGEGYRSWKDKTGKAVFAKLKTVDANLLTLTTEWGEDFKTFANRLSEEDQQWIETQRLARQRS